MMGAPPRVVVRLTYWATNWNVVAMSPAAVSRAGKPPPNLVPLSIPPVRFAQLTPTPLICALQIELGGAHSTRQLQVPPEHASPVVVSRHSSPGRHPASVVHDASELGPILRNPHVPPEQSASDVHTLPGTEPPKHERELPAS